MIFIVVHVQHVQCTASHVANLVMKSGATLTNVTLAMVSRLKERVKVGNVSRRSCYLGS